MLWRICLFTSSYNDKLTGVPLPFLSYGGSYTICLMIALSLVQRVSIETNIQKQKELKKLS